MSNDILKIDTSVNLGKTEVIEPLPVYDDNSPMLRMVMPEYTDPLPSPAMNKLIKQLHLTRQKYKGLGLSANQCGIMKRVFVIGYEDMELAFINPKVINMSDDLKKEPEGCLSYPGLFLKISRPSWIEVEFINQNGETKTTTLSGLTARCFLHELDHMNGIRFVEHAGSLAIKMAKQKQQKMLKKIKRAVKNNELSI
jgi:peptide deformylase